MRIWGGLLAVVVLLAGAACTRDVAGSPAAGDAPPAAPVSAPESSKAVVAECTDCDSDAVDDAIENPVVAKEKRVGTPPACEDIMPLATIGQVVGAPAHASTAASKNECAAEYETADHSRFGTVLVNFSGPVRLEPVAIGELAGNTLLESEISTQTCEYGLAIDDSLDDGDHGSWLTLRVISTNGGPSSCPPARQLIEIAFGNLPAA